MRPGPASPSGRVRSCRGKRKEGARRGTWLHGGMVQVPEAATRRGLQKWRTCAEGQILSSSQGEGGDAVLQHNFKNEVYRWCEPGEADSAVGLKGTGYHQSPLISRAHSHHFNSWPDYDGNIFPATEVICPFPSSTSLLTPAQSFWRIFWSTLQGDST